MTRLLKQIVLGWLLLSGLIGFGAGGAMAQTVIARSNFPGSANTDINGTAATVGGNWSLGTDKPGTFSLDGSGGIYNSGATHDTFYTLPSTSSSGTVTIEADIYALNPTPGNGFQLIATRAGGGRYGYEGGFYWEGNGSANTNASIGKFVNNGGSAVGISATSSGIPVLTTGKYYHFRFDVQNGSQVLKMGPAQDAPTTYPYTGTYTTLTSASDTDYVANGPVGIGAVDYALGSSTSGIHLLNFQATVPAAGANPTNFPLSAISRWGSWSVQEDTPASSGMNSKESQIAFGFTGTGASLNMQIATGQATFQGGLFSVSVDGVTSLVNLSSNFTSTNTEFVQPICSGLSEGNHQVVVSIANTYYQIPYQWAVDIASAVTITGASPAILTASPRTISTANLSVDDGDSLTQGFASSGVQGSAFAGTSYPAVLQQSLGSTYTSVNQGTYSETVDAMLSRASSDVDTQYNPANTINQLVFFGGRNNVSGGETAASLESKVQSYVQARKAKGWNKIILVTIPTYNANAIASAFNAWEKANVSALGIFAVADAAAVIVPGDYDPDQLHLRDAGYAKVANAVYLASQGTPLSSVSLSSILLGSGGITFTAAPTGGTGPFTYTLTRSGMTAVTNTTGTLLDPSPIGGALNTYTVSVTDSAATPVTKIVTQSVAPIGTAVVNTIKRKVQ